MRLEINYRKKTAKNKHMEAKQHATKQPMGYFKEEVKKYLETNENKNTMIQNLGMQQKQF